MTHDHVEFVAVHDEKAPAVGSLVLGVAHDLDAAEREADELARELVVIAGDEHHARAAPHFAQQFLDHVVMRLRPVEARPHAPAVDDVADQKIGVGFVVPEEIEHQLGLAAARAEMHVGEEDGAVSGDTVHFVPPGGGPFRAGDQLLNSLTSVQILVSAR